MIHEKKIEVMIRNSHCYQQKCLHILSDGNSKKEHHFNTDTLNLPKFYQLNW